jgi:hypothetical protein
MTVQMFARAGGDGTIAAYDAGRGDANIIQKIRITVGFVMSEAEFGSFARYVVWRRQNPISD